MENLEPMYARGRQRAKRRLRWVIHFTNQSCSSGGIVARNDGPPGTLNESMALSFRDRMREDFLNLFFVSRKSGGDKSDPDAGLRASRQWGAWIDFQKPVPHRLNQSSGCIFDWKNGVRRLSGIDGIKYGLE
jgi:hypothetical protein